MAVLKALEDKHIEDKLPIIIEGNFINLGDLQQYRAEISIAYGKWIVDTCKQNRIIVIKVRL